MENKYGNYIRKENTCGDMRDKKNHISRTCCTITFHFNIGNSLFDIRYSFLHGNIILDSLHRTHEFTGAAGTAFHGIDYGALPFDFYGVGRTDSDTGSARFTELLIDDHHDVYLSDRASIRCEFGDFSSIQLFVRFSGSSVGYLPEKQASQYVFPSFGTLR